MNEILIRKAKKGDKDAFCRLIDENVQSMYKVAAAYLKNDEDVADIRIRCRKRLFTKKNMQQWNGSRL